MFFDPMYFVFMIPGMIFMLWAQMKVKGTYRQYANKSNSLGITGAQAARRILDAAGLRDVTVSQTPGELNDHYDPRKRALYLSPRVYNDPSIASIGIAAHEAGHALQHKAEYAPLTVWGYLFKPARFSPMLGVLMIMFGLFAGSIGLAWVGIVLFSLATVYALVTLPIEFDASKRARSALVAVGIADGGLDDGPEIAGVKKVLDAAAWTYIAGFAVALLELLYYVSLVSGMGRDE